MRDHHWSSADVRNFQGIEFPDGDIGTLKNFDTCAVVGSSSSLMQSQYGESIDNHTAVIRFNAAPTIGRTIC